MHEECTHPHTILLCDTCTSEHIICSTTANKYTCTSGNVEHCWQTGATQPGICQRCWGCISQRKAFLSWSKTEPPVAVTCVLYNYCQNGTYFQVAPSNHEDWEEVQPRSVTEGCNACSGIEFSQARSTSKSHMDGKVHTLLSNSYQIAIYSLSLSLVCNKLAPGMKSGVARNHPRKSSSTDGFRPLLL